MGIVFSTVWLLRSLFSEWGIHHARILMLGLDGAGKTAILYRMKSNEIVSPIPTKGFNREEMPPVNNITFAVWDVSGQDEFRPLWKHYFKDVHGLIYVVNSADQERFLDAKSELHIILDAPQMEGVPVVVIANKQDLTGAAKTDKLADVLGLTQEKCGHPCRVLAASAVTGEGIQEAMEQLAEMVTQFQNKRTEDLGTSP